MTVHLPRILILTTFDLDEYIYEAMQAGASGFVLKDDPPEQLLATSSTGSFPATLTTFRGSPLPSTSADPSRSEPWSRPLTLVRTQPCDR